MRHRLLFVVLLSAVCLAGAQTSQLFPGGNADRSIEALRSRVQASALDADAHHSLCRAYYEIEHWDEAVNACQKAVDLQPTRSLFHLWLGRAYGEQASRANFLRAARLARKVRQHFERAVELNGQRADARQDLAEFYIEAPSIMGGGLDKAARLADEVQGHNAASAHWIRARIAEKKNDFGTAEREYKQAIETSKTPAQAHLDLASFYRRQERFAEMEKTIQTAVAAEPDNGAILFEAAEIYHRAGRNFGDAAKLLRKYLDSGKPSEQVPLFHAHYLLGLLLEKQNDRKGAVTQYKLALELASQFKPAREGLSRVNM